LRFSEPQAAIVTTNKEDALSRLERVFQEVFDDDALRIREDMTRETFPAWDSLGHIRLVSALEETFGVSFSIEEIEGMTSVGRILEGILAKS
jgi:acyl carrier protein